MSFGIEFLTEEQAKEKVRTPCVAILCPGLLRRGMVYVLERELRVCDGFLCSMSATYVVQYCSGSGSTNKLFIMCFLLCQEAIEVIINVLMCYVRWHWKSPGYSSCIVLCPLQVGCHLMSRIIQQWVTVVNSWQSNSRYQCGSCKYLSGIYELLSTDAGPSSISEQFFIHVHSY